jgi:hypothetical protein
MSVGHTLSALFEEECPMALQVDGWCNLRGLHLPALKKLLFISFYNYPESSQCVNMYQCCQQKHFGHDCIGLLAANTMHGFDLRMISDCLEPMAGRSTDSCGTILANSM